MCCVACERSDAGCSQAGRSLGTDPHSVKVVSHYIVLVEEYAISVNSAMPSKPGSRGQSLLISQPQVKTTGDDVFGLSHRMISTRPPIL